MLALVRKRKDACRVAPLPSVIYLGKHKINVILNMK